MDFTNGQKSKHGSNAQYSIEELLSYCKKQNYISNYLKGYRIGKDGFQNKEQFYAAFIITFNNTEQWILFSTTSMRTDRIKGQQWDSYNLKNINPSITKSIIVYPDASSVSEIEKFTNQNKKYASGFEFSAIDSIVNQDELSKLIEENATKHLNSGQIKDIQGKNFEDRVAEVLSSRENLKKWRTGDMMLTGLHFNMFEEIVHAMLLEVSEISMIEATTDKDIIGKLPTGGNPKTDVLVKISKNDATAVEYTISCKRTSAKNVSVHQYSADSFADVLDGDNTELRKKLVEFQNSPTLSSFGEENGKQLTQLLSPYNEKLTLWVLGGIGGDCSNEIQCASHILTYNNNNSNLSIHTISEYYELLKNSDETGHFGTFFTWTYPSGRRGTSIQLKCKIV